MSKETKGALRAQIAGLAAAVRELTAELRDARAPLAFGAWHLCGSCGMAAQAGLHACGAATTIVTAPLPEAPAAWPVSSGGTIAPGAAGFHPVFTVSPDRAYSQAFANTGCAPVNTSFVNLGN